MSEFQTVSESELQSVEGGLAPVLIVAAVVIGVAVFLYSKKAN